MATHSSVLSWRIPGTGEPPELLSMGSHRVGHAWSDLAAAAACMDVSLDLKKNLSAKELMLLNLVLEKTLESPLNCKEIKPVNPKGNQPWIFIGRTDTEVEAPILWLLDTKSWLIHWKRPWCWERLRAGEGGDREWDVWMASPTQWTNVHMSLSSWTSLPLFPSIGCYRAPAWFPWVIQ